MAPEGRASRRGKTLASVEVGGEARIAAIEGEGRVKARLLQMGLVPGAVVKVERVAPLGDPLEVVVGGTHLSLRREEADCVLVEEVGER